MAKVTTAGTTVNSTWRATALGSGRPVDRPLSPPTTTAADVPDDDDDQVTVIPDAVNLGIAIDLVKADGSRNLVVPSIKNTGGMDFRQFWQSYEDVVRRARRNELTMDDYAGTTISLTTPGGTGYIKRYAYDPCGETQPPPYFPTTGHFTKAQIYQVDPTGFSVASYFKMLSAGS